MVWLVKSSAREQNTLHRLGRDRRLPHGVQFARRTRQHDHRRAVGNLDHESRSCARWIECRRPNRHHRLLAIGRLERLGIESHSPGEAGDDRGDLRLHLLVENQLDAGEARHDFGRQIVSCRPEPAAGDDQVAAVSGHEPQTGFEVLGPVTDDQDVRDLYALRSQSL